MSGISTPARVTVRSSGETVNSSNRKRGFMRRGIIGGPAAASVHEQVCAALFLPRLPGLLGQGRNRLELLRRELLVQGRDLPGDRRLVLRARRFEILAEGLHAGRLRRGRPP